MVKHKQAVESMISDILTDSFSPGKEYPYVDREMLLDTIDTVKSDLEEYYSILDEETAEEALKSLLTHAVIFYISDGMDKRGDILDYNKYSDTLENLSSVFKNNIDMGFVESSFDNSFD